MRLIIRTFWLLALPLLWLALHGQLLVRRFDRNTGGRDFEGGEVPPSAPPGPRPAFRRATPEDGAPMPSDGGVSPDAMRRTVRRVTLPGGDPSIRRDAGITIGLLGAAAAIGFVLTVFVIGGGTDSPTPSSRLAVAPSTGEPTAAASASPTGAVAGATPNASPSPSEPPPSPSPAPAPALPEVTVALGETDENGVPHVRVSWSEVPDATGYELAYARDDGDWQGVELSSADDTSVTFELVPDEAYRFRVRAVADDEPTDWSVSRPMRLSVVEEDAEAVSYEGSWSEARHPAYVGDDVLFASNDGASASISFEGAGIAWRGPVGPGRGRAEVIVDGSSKGRVDAGSSGFVPVNSLFATSWPADGEHELEVVVEGTDERPVVAIDAFYVLEPVAE